VKEAAKGRIWTGEEAKGLGLVDELGGYSEALQLVREAIGRPGGAALRVKLIPRPARLLDPLVSRRAESSDHHAEAAISPTSIAGGLFGLASSLSGLTGGLGDGAVLAMPKLQVDL
jgi:protease-4